MLCACGSCDTRKIGEVCMPPRQDCDSSASLLQARYGCPRARPSFLFLPLHQNRNACICVCVCLILSEFACPISFSVCQSMRVSTSLFFCTINTTVCTDVQSPEWSSWPPGLWPREPSPRLRRSRPTLVAWVDRHCDASRIPAPQAVGAYPTFLGHGSSSSSSGSQDDGFAGSLWL